MKPLIAKLREAGCTVEEGINDVRVVGPKTQADYNQDLALPRVPNGYAGPGHGHDVHCRWTEFGP